MYFPYLDAAPAAKDLVSLLDPETMTLVMRTTADPNTAGQAVERLVHRLDADAPVTDVITMEQAIGEKLAQPRFYLILLAGFAAIAMLLAAVGVYGTISYSVARRQHEIGVRLALGATRQDAFWLIARQGMRMAIIGGAVGLLAALGLTRLLRTLLYGVSPLDLVTFASASLLLGLVALGACWIPARRASRVDPVRALRTE
jgi:putative ABC transport system permease protein